MKKLLLIMLSLIFIGKNIKADSITNAYLQKQPGVQKLRTRVIENRRAQAQLNDASSSTQGTSVPAYRPTQEDAHNAHTPSPKTANKKEGHLKKMVKRNMY
jgi:hypothetical protein